MFIPTEKKSSVWRKKIMFCGKCGTDNPDTNKFCKNCGRALRRVEPSDVPAPAVPAPVAATAPPVTTVPSSPGYSTAQSRMEPVPVPGFIGILTQRKYMVAGVICGVASALILPYILGVAAIILGIWAITKKDKLGVIGIIIGSLVIVVNYFYLVIFP